jgi:hypothetical protein
VIHSLVINPPGQRLTGKGLVFAYNGVIIQTPLKQMSGKGCMCGGMGSSYYSVSSEFGKIKV